MRTLTICTLSMAFTIAHADSSSTDPSKACFLSLSDNPDLSVLKDKIAISDVNSQTIEMLSNEKRPTVREKASLSKWVTETEKCKKLGDAWRQTNLPGSLVTIVDQYFLKLKLMTSDLYAGKINYGTYAKNRAELFSKTNGEMIKVNEQIKSDNQSKLEKLNQEAIDAKRHQEEIDATNLQKQQEIKALNEQREQSQRNAELLLEQQKKEQAQRNAILLQQRIDAQNQLYQQQQNQVMSDFAQTLRNNANRPLPQPIVNPNTTTNCRWIGNTLNCNTY